MTTIERVKAIASHLEVLDDDQIQMYIDDAQLEMEGLEYETKFTEKIERYLAAHYATIDVRRASSEKMEDMQIVYEGSPTPQNKDFLSTTRYGQEVLRMFEQGKGLKLILNS